MRVVYTVTSSTDWTFVVFTENLTFESWSRKVQNQANQADGLTFEYQTSYTNLDTVKWGSSLKIILGEKTASIDKNSASTEIWREAPWPFEVYVM